MSPPSGAGSPPALALALLLIAAPLTEATASTCADWSARPGWRGQLDLTSGAMRIVASGDRAWISDGGTVLTVIDISDPSSPQPSGSVTLPEPIAGLVTDGTWLYASTETSSLLVLDLANPDAPVVVGSVPTAGDSFAPVIHGASVYIPLGSGGFEIVDVSVPSNPVSVVVASQYPANQIAVAGDRAVTTARGSPFQAIFRVWDLSVPSAPAPRGLLMDQGHFTLDIWFGDVVLEGSTAYYLSSSRYESFGNYFDHGGVRSADISDPDNPVPGAGGGFGYGGCHAARLRRLGDRLYAQYTERGIQIYAGVGSSSLVDLHRLQVESGRDLAVVPTGPLAITLRDDGLETWSVAHPEEPSYVDPFQLNTSIHDLVVTGSFGYSLTRYWAIDPVGIPWEYIEVWDLSDPASPVEISSVGEEWGSGAKTFVRIGDVLYLPGNQLHRTSLPEPGGTPLLPEIVGTVTGPFSDGAAAGSYLYVGSHLGGITVLDASGQGEPFPVRTDGTWPVHQLEAEGSLGVVGMADRVAVLDLSEPALPAYRGTVEGLLPYPPVWLDLSGTRAAVGYVDTVYLLDLTDPDLPQEIASWSHPGSGKAGRIVGDVVYVGTSVRGCFAWDISDPGDIQPLGIWSTGETYGFEPIGDRLLSFSVGGLAPLIPACASSAVDVPEIVPAPGGLRLAAGPNPFRGGTTIRWEAPAGPRVRLDVLDTAGRRVRRLVTGTALSGAITWDGRDGAGRPVAAGVYFLRLEAPGGSAVGKVTRLR